MNSDLKILGTIILFLFNNSLFLFNSFPPYRSFAYVYLLWIVKLSESQYAIQIFKMMYVVCIR